MNTCTDHLPDFPTLRCSRHPGHRDAHRAWHYLPDGRRVRVEWTILPSESKPPKPAPAEPGVVEFPAFTVTPT